MTEINFHMNSIVPWYSCSQIVPVKVKYFQTALNETKNDLKNWNSILGVQSLLEAVSKLSFGPMSLLVPRLKSSEY